MIPWFILPIVVLVVVAIVAISFSYKKDNSRLPSARKQRKITILNLENRIKCHIDQAAEQGLLDTYIQVRDEELDYLEDILESRGFEYVIATRHTTATGNYYPISIKVSW